MTLWGMIDARPVVVPMVIEEFNAAFVLYSVPAAVARELVPGDAFELIEHEPGAARLVVAALDYRRNAWGEQHDELDLAVSVKPVGAPDETDGGLIFYTPVNDQFPCEVGHRVLAFPTTVEDIETRYAPDEVSFRVVREGRSAFGIRLPRPAPDGEPFRIETTSYAYVDGEPYGARVTIDMPPGVVTNLDAVELEIGTGPIADQLRAFGLPKAPDSCVWGEGLSAVFHQAEPVQPA